MKPTLILLAAGLALAACSGGSLFPTPTLTPVPPTVTPTPVPLAARVDGRGILLADFQAEIARFEAAQAELGTDLASLGDYRGDVLQALIDRLLLAQAPVEAGQDVGSEELQAEIDRLAAARGGNEAMGAWLAANGYTVEAFERALREDMLATRMVEQITEAIGETAEQVRAAHLLVATRAEAESLRAQLAGGADFAELARRWSLDPSTRPAGGDLGWFPSGYLLVPQVDQVAWNLPVGEVSPVIESALGYHIVVVLERGEQPLSPDARRFLRERAVEDWLVERRAAAQIEIIPSP